MNEQHELFLAAYRRASKYIKQIAKTTAVCIGGSILNIPKDNLYLLKDQPEGRNKILDNYKSELFVIVSKHKAPNVYKFHPMCGGMVHTVT